MMAEMGGGPPEDLDDRGYVEPETEAYRLSKVTLVHDNFENVASILDRLGLDGVDGILLDLGVSSPHARRSRRL